MNEMLPFFERMSALDYVFVMIVFLSAILGMWRGIVSEVLSVLSWLLALLAAWFYASEIAPLFAQSIDVPLWRLVVAFVLIFVVVLLLVSLIRHGLRELLHALGLRSIDRFFGFLFGSVRGLVVALLLVMVGGLTGVAAEPWWRASRIAPYLEYALVMARPWMPSVIADHLHLQTAFPMPPLNEVPGGLPIESPIHSGTFPPSPLFHPAPSSGAR
jgi:membrane protein required for colicin V production